MIQVMRYMYTGFHTSNFSSQNNALDLLDPRGIYISQIQQM